MGGVIAQKSAHRLPVPTKQVSKWNFAAYVVLMAAQRLCWRACIPPYIPLHLWRPANSKKRRKEAVCRLQCDALSTLLACLSSSLRMHNQCQVCAALAATYSPQTSLCI
uniref:Uncharacterized protein n=1 Tax=Eutreptiella gymnastica TaxID=73025 RepID=A0A7S4G658_9EUGL